MVTNYQLTLLLLAIIIINVSTIFACAANSDEELLKAEVRGIINGRRRTRQECLVLGFITDQLECETCDILKKPLEADGASKTSETVYSDSDIYYQCRSCCTQGKLGGDAMRLPHDEAQEGNGVAKKIQPYDLPPTKTYAKARIELSSFAFDAAGADWSKLMNKLPTEFPLPKAAKKKATRGDSEEGEESLVSLYASYNRQSFIQLYDEGQEVARGPPERLISVGDEPSMVLDITHWDAGKLEEFLRHTIAGSKYNLELKQKELLEATATSSKDEL